MVLLTLAFTFLGLIFFAFDACYIRTPVIGYSMRPTINKDVTSDKEQGDIVYINKFREVKVGDIVSADAGELYEDYIIKRLVAKEGDKLKIINNENEFVLVCNDRELYTVKKSNNSKAYYACFLELVDSYDPNLTGVDANGVEYIVIKQGEAFLMSDNWNENVIDCVTQKTAVDINEIVGGVDIIFYKNESKLTLITKILKLIF